jgi:hypothetical protein
MCIVESPSQKLFLIIYSMFSILLKAILELSPPITQISASILNLSKHEFHFSSSKTMTDLIITKQVNFATPFTIQKIKLHYLQINLYYC